MPAVLPDLPRVAIASREEWRSWLFDHHASSGSIWLVVWKKGRGPGGRGYVTYDEIVEEALCFGWVDSRPAKLDEDRSMLLLSPRKPGSNWSALNKQRVERLTMLGLMQPSGLALVERSKADGTWTALDLVEALIEPDDLVAALDANPAARANWDGFARSARRGILEWIQAAKTPQTRARRIADTASKAAIGIKANFPEGRNGAKPIALTKS